MLPLTLKCPRTHGSERVYTPDDIFSSPTNAVDSEAWRYTGPFTRFNRFRGAFPGLGIATVAFAGYLVYEQMFLTSSHGHGEGHGDEHH